MIINGRHYDYSFPFILTHLYRWAGMTINELLNYCFRNEKNKSKTDSI